MHDVFQHLPLQGFKALGKSNVREHDDLRTCLIGMHRLPVQVVHHSRHPQNSPITVLQQQLTVKSSMTLQLLQDVCIQLGAGCHELLQRPVTRYISQRIARQTRETIVDGNGIEMIIRDEPSTVAALQRL